MWFLFLSCRRYFVDMRSLKEHFKTKVHKKRSAIHSALIVLDLLHVGFIAYIVFSTQAEAAQRGALQPRGGRESSRHGLIHPSKNHWSEDPTNRREHGMKIAAIYPRTDLFITEALAVRLILAVRSNAECCLWRVYSSVSCDKCGLFDHHIRRLLLTIRSLCKYKERQNFMPRW